MKIIKVGRAQSSSALTPPRPPKQQQGQIINLRAPEPAKKPVRSISTPQEKVPGLAIHIPESMSRQSSQQSAQQQESLEQLQKLRLELLGERKQQQQKPQRRQPTPTSREIIFGDQKPLRLQATPTSWEKIMRDQKQTIPPRDILIGDDAPRDQPESSSVVVPPPSPFNSLYSGAGGLLKSPLSCMSMDQMLSQVDDSEQGADSNDPVAASRKAVELQTRQSSDMTHSTQRSQQQQQQQQMLSKTTGRTRSSRASVKPIIVPIGYEGSDQQAFNMQKSLDHQLAGLPGSRLPGSSGKSFDDHSYIISSGTKPLGSKSKTQRLEQVVSIVPCDSYAPTLKNNSINSTRNVAEVRSKKPIPLTLPTTTKSKRSVRPKRPPPDQRVDTVQIDNGLTCVDPNNLKPQMQELLQKKAGNTKQPRQQVAQVFEAKDLVELSTSKRKTNKHKLSIGTKLKGILHSPRRGVQNKKKENKKQTDNEWYKQTIGQDSYKITKVMGADIKNKGAGKGGALPAPGKSGNDSKPGRNMEVVMAAEGDSPMFKVPHMQEKGGKDVPLTGVAATMTGNLKEKDNFVALPNHHRVDRKSSGGVNKRTDNTAIIVEELGLRPLSTQKGVDSFGLNGSPSLETLNTYKVNEVVKLFAQEQAAGRINIPTGGSEEDAESGDKTGKAASEKKKRKEALHDAKIAIIFSLKQKILNELTKQKLREQEAASRGETISDEEKEKALDEVRKLHMHREALQQISESSMQKVYIKRLLGTKVEDDKEDTGDQPVEKVAGEEEKEAESDSDSGVESIGNGRRKSVTFAGVPRGSRRDDDESLLTSQLPHRGLMSWAQCGINPAAVGGCDPLQVTDQSSSGSRNAPPALPKNAQMQALGAAALKSVDLVAKDSFIKAQAGAQQMAYARAKARANEDYFSDDSSCASAGGRGAPKTESPSTPEKSKKDKPAVVLSRSASLQSEGSFETRDTRHTEYTEQTEDSRGSYRSRDSYYSYDSRDSYDSRRDRRRKKSPRRSSCRGSKQPVGRRRYGRHESYSVAGTEFTEDNYEEFGCQGFWEPTAFK